MFVLMGGGRTSKPFRDSGAPDALGEELQGRFIYWRGRSGQRYLHTVYAVDALPEFTDAVVILARRDRRGRSGDNADYVLATVEHLAELGADDPALRALADRLLAWRRNGATRPGEEETPSGEDVKPLSPLPPRSRSGTRP